MEQGSRIWNKDVADKYGIPRNTVSTWFKNKEKLCSKRKKLHAGEFEDVDKAVYLWFVAKRSQQVPIDGVLLKKRLWISRIF